MGATKKRSREEKHSAKKGGGNGDVKTMLRAADTAMYEAKRAGGDRFMHA